MLITLAAYLHTIDPYAIKLWEGGPIRWYGLSYLFGFFLGYLLIRRVTRVGRSTLKPEAVADLIVWVAFGVMIGGRLGYALFYDLPLFVTFSSDAPYWQLLAINKGGMASHGGMVGAIVACALFARRRGQPLPFILDLIAFPAPLGMFFGRLANFVNGELYGRPCSPDLPWAVKFPKEMYEWFTTDPAKIAKLAPALKYLPHAQGNSTYGPTRGDVDQIVNLIQNGQQQVIAIVEPLLTPRHPSQIYQALLGGLAVFIVLAILWARPRKPLIVGSAYIAVYGVMRIIGELFREPDTHIRSQEFATLGVTRGQLLSIGLIVAGLVLMAIFSRRKVDPMGGWLPTDHAD